MNYIGFNSLVDYDWLPWWTDTCIGPLWDLKSGWKIWNRVDIDFWGMTNFREKQSIYRTSYQVICFLFPSSLLFVKVSKFGQVLGIMKI